MNIGQIPDTLKEREQWIAWGNECRECSKVLVPTIKECPDCGEKTTKRPYDPQRNDTWAKSDDPDTWATLEAAVEHFESNDDMHGIGFMFADDGELVGVDLDGCRDPDSGEIDGWAEDIIERLDSYTEVSPSGTGVHIIAKGTKPEGRNKRDVGDGEIEMYDVRRYFTMTGEVLDYDTE